MNNDQVELMNIVICHSDTARNHAETLKTALRSWANATLWEELYNDSSIDTITLLNKVKEFDMCIVLFTTEDGELLYEKHHKSSDALLSELALSMAYIGRKNTIVAMDFNSKESFDTFLALDTPAFIIHRFSTPIEELIAKIELYCYENKIRWNNKEQSNLSISKQLKEERIRMNLSRTKAIMDMTKGHNFLGYNRLDAENAENLIKKYSFPFKYSDNTDIELFLIADSDKTIVTDKGKTIQVINEAFELRASDVIQMLNKIMKKFNVSFNNDASCFFIPINSFTEGQDDDTEEIRGAVFRLFSCITFMDTMRIFYT
jgi:hypothetical protein